MKLFEYFLLKYAKENTDDLLKKRISPNDTIAQQLLKHDVIPIIAPRENRNNLDYPFQSTVDTAFLGSGNFSDVFEVSYKGKRAVAKITQSTPDVRWVLLLNALRTKLGNDAKYIMEVYAHFKINGDKNIDGDKNVIVAEKLEPVNSHILAVLDYFSSGSKNHNKVDWKRAKEYMFQSNIVKTLEDEVTSFTSNLTRSLSEVTSFTSNLTRSLPEVQLFKQTLKDTIVQVLNNSNDFDEFNRNITAELIQFTKDYGTKYQLVDFAQEINSHIKQFRHRIRYLIDRIRSQFPVNYNDFTPEKLNYFEERPETKDFVRFLMRLKKEFGIEFQDLHVSNIMQRASTGDLVISDPGLFKKR